ncbi:response regulator transcription factor [Paenibacillus sp. SYP-B3998]|uniref:Response regulator transcription factor n=1 Tax=Paenibacillus sp. SYP-B3998 TaxID=2678564 RepID=A0A6G4A206_9BACL|nr:response regulator transcription factor [Paenibacillus sp. SYP-B3998]NEW08503.1 response regulator transcription factor [Paenibacillus sp. SYP-B3998]
MYKVLVIEDDAMIGDMVSMYLGEEGFKVIRHENGRDGLQAVHQFGPDIILLDLILPDMDGLELCQQVREISKIPIMIVSMKNKVVERVNALAVGADDYMCKPFSMHEMSARVHALIRRSKLYQPKRSANAPSSNTAVMVAERDADNLVSLDQDTRSMWVHGDLIETTYSEFEIMKCFLKNPGRVFSREDLLQTVRGFDSFVTDRAIDVHIANLRKKIEVNPKEPKRIRTVWGVGYKFVL